MQLTHHPTDREIGIDGYSTGRITAAGQVFERPVRLAWNCAPQAIELPPIEELSEQDLLALLPDNTDLVLLGSGQRQAFPPARTLAGIQRLGIGCECMLSSAACRTYNVLISEQRRVLALIHP